MVEFVGLRHHGLSGRDQVDHVREQCLPHPGCGRFDQVQRRRPVDQVADNREQLGGQRVGLVAGCTGGTPRRAIALLLQRLDTIPTGPTFSAVRLEIAICAGGTKR